MCQYVDAECIAPGWGCCNCLKERGAGQYNGMQRAVCRTCGKPPCAVLTPDKDTGKVFENRNYHETLYEELGIKPAVVRPCANVTAHRIEDLIEFTPMPGGGVRVEPRRGGP